MGQHSDLQESNADTSHPPRWVWMLAPSGCVAWALAILGAMYALIGPGNLPPQVVKQVQAKPWVFLRFILIGFAIAVAGVSGVIRRRAENVVDAPFARDEYTGTSAVVVGLGQCLAGSAAVGACLYLLLFS